MNEADHAVTDLTATISPTAVLGCGYRPLLDGRRLETGEKAQVGRGAWIGNYCVVGQDVVIGDHSIIQEYSCIEAGARIGSHVLVRHRTTISAGARIGDHCIVHGHIGERVVIGSNCRVFGQFVHQQLDPTKGWDDPCSEEPSAEVCDGAFVGWNAIVIGPVVIGERAYVCAGAIVTRNVPPGHIAYDRNEIIHHSAWPGALSQSPFFAG